jgi:hypothetical protein
MKGLMMFGKIIYTLLKIQETSNLFILYIKGR